MAAQQINRLDMVETLRIATSNLESLGRASPDGPTLVDRLAALQPQILRLRADVLCLQEVNAGREHKGEPRRLLALERLLEATPYAGWPMLSTTGPAGVGPMDVHNLVIVTRLPVLERRQLRHDLVPAPNYRAVTPEAIAEAEPVGWDRPLLYARLELDQGRNLHLLNLHLRAPLAVPLAGQKAGPFVWKSTAAWAEGFFLAAIKRAGQALEARLLVDRLFDAEPEALILVTGDFNADEREVPVRIVMGRTEDTGSGRLAARALVPLERSLPESQRFSVLHHGHPQMLDHLLVSRPLLAHYRASEIHNEDLGDEAVGYAEVEASPDSYHAPLVAEFQIPDGPV